MSEKQLSTAVQNLERNITHGQIAEDLPLKNVEE
jgi:hypothetical protein